MSETQCTICHGSFPLAQIFTLDGRAVCAGCKPAVLARVLSGEPAPLEPVALVARVMEFWETVGIGWKVIRNEWLNLLILGLIVAVPLNWLLAQVPLPDDESMQTMMRAWRLQQLGQTVIGVLATLGTAYIVKERLEGRRATLSGALRHAVGRWLSAIGTAWLEGIYLTVLMLLLIVPGVIFAGYYVFTMIAVSLRGCGGTRALSYSKSLVKGRWWRVVGYALGFFMPALFIVFVIGLLSGLLPETPIMTLASDVLNDLTIGLTTVFLTILFLNLDKVQRTGETTGETSVLNRRLGQHHGV